MQSHKALILNGTQTDDDAIERAQDLIVRRLNDAGWDAAVLTLRTMTFSGCAACPEGDCGELDNCNTHDDGDRVRDTYKSSDLVVILTPLITGVYSYRIKNALDRLSPLYVPGVHRDGKRFRVVKPDVSAPALLAVGVADAPDKGRKRLFQSLTERTAHRFSAPAHCALTLYRCDSHKTWEHALTESIAGICTHITG